MRFEYYHEGLAEAPLLSVDGTVDGARHHLSHWQNNETPAELRADTSTEIALNFVSSPRRDEYARGIEIVTNNHFDTDGVLSVWTVTTGERALDLREPLIAAAEAGDFSEFSGERGVRASIVIQGADDDVLANGGVASPLARSLAGGAHVDERRAYELVLPEVERVLTRTDEYEPLWRAGWSAVEAALESFARGESRVDEDEATGLSVVTLARALYGPGGFKPTRHVPPFTAISHNARGTLFLIAAPADDGWSYRVDYPYYSWAVTVVRPRVERRDLSVVIARLNELEGDGEASGDDESGGSHDSTSGGGGGGRWMKDSSGLTSALKFADSSGAPRASRLAPDEVARVLRAELRERKESAAKREEERAARG